MTARETLEKWAAWIESDADTEAYLKMSCAMDAAAIREVLAELGQRGMGATMPGDCSQIEHKALRERAETSEAELAGAKAAAILAIETLTRERDEARAESEQWRAASDACEMDWSDEVRARLVREEERLRYKAANLQARGKTVMAAQELVVADDIRAALGEIERLKREQDAMVEEGVAPLIEALRERAEAAEAKLALWEGLPASMREHGIETGNLPVNVGAAIAQAIVTLRAKVQRLRGVLGLVLTETGLQAHKHGCPERLRRPAQWDQTLPCAGCAAEAALSTEEDR